MNLKHILLFIIFKYYIYCESSWPSESSRLSQNKAQIDMIQQSQDFTNNNHNMIKINDIPQDRAIILDFNTEYRQKIIQYTQQINHQNQQKQHPVIDEPNSSENQPHTTQQQAVHHYLHPSTMQFWINLLISAFLTCVGGFCSGMTVGLMSIQTIQLEIMKLSKNKQQKQMGETILSVVQNHHLILVTLLLTNAMALQTLPLVVHSLMPAWAAILFSTFFVLVLGQIVPQAYCTGAKKLELAYFAAPLLKAMMKALWFLAYPMSKGLDYLLGVHHHQRIQHKDFVNLLRGQNKSLKKSEGLLLTSILQLRTKRVHKFMVPLEKLYMINFKDTLNGKKVQELNKKQYSYIFVYKQRKQNIVGLIKVKEFALNYLKSGAKTVLVKDIVREENILSVYSDTNLLEMLMLFQANSKRLALVSGQFKKDKGEKASIQFSKSEMKLGHKTQNIVGAIFVYSIFEEITKQNLIMEQAQVIKKSDHQPKEMEQLKKPLMEH